MKTSYLFLADGFEEIEALATVDVLRRAGMAVRTMSINANNRLATGAHGVTVTADLALDTALLDDAQWLILPGGMPGASNLAACQPLTTALLAHHEKEAPIAAICASPSIVLAPLGMLDGRDAVCYPGMENRNCGARWADAMVAHDGHIITGRGPAAATHFALAIVTATLGDDTAHEVAAGMLL